MSSGPHYFISLLLSKLVDVAYSIGLYISAILLNRRKGLLISRWQPWMSPSPFSRG